MASAVGTVTCFMFPLSKTGSSTGNHGPVTADAPSTAKGAATAGHVSRTALAMLSEGTLWRLISQLSKMTSAGGE